MLPWYEKRYLLDGLEEEGILRSAEGGDAPVPVRERDPGRQQGTQAAMTHRKVAVAKWSMP